MIAPRVRAKAPADLVDQNCLIDSGLRESVNWPFVGPNEPSSVSVRGNLSSNSIETIRTGVLASLGIGFFAKLSLADKLAHPDVVTILDDFVKGVRDVSLVAQTPVRANPRAPHDRFFRGRHTAAHLGLGLVAAGLSRNSADHERGAPRGGATIAGEG